ncbi:MAG: hypothetical protein Q8K98_12085 [Bacteroidota bacterium]|nr:hypothetical protein [Bacteroidota bacterium]
MENYRIIITATVNSSLSREDLEARLVFSLFDVETEIKISDGDNDQLQVVDYASTEAVPITKNKF